MSQVDYVTADQSGASFRTDLNSFWLAIVSKNSGATEPATKFAFMWWMDTTTGLLKQRNAINTAWIILGDPELANFGLARLSVVNTFAEEITHQKNIIMSAAGIEGAETTLAINATTMNPWNGGDTRKLTGSALTITDLADAPAAGLWRKVINNAAHTWTDNATLEVFGDANFVAEVDDICWLYSKSTTVTTVIPMKKNGEAVVGGGQVVQSVHVQDGNTAQDLSPTAMALNDTIPINTEGLEVMTLAITAANSSNKFLIEVIVNFSTTGLSNTNTVALFKDSIANAIAVVPNFQSASNRLSTLALRHEIVAGSTSAQTFKVRIGAEGTDDLYFNSILGARKYGGVMSSTIHITESLP